MSFFPNNLDGATAKDYLRDMMKPSTYPFRRQRTLLRRFIRQPRWRRLGVVVLKASLFQCFSSLATFLLVMGFTGNVTISASISLADLIGKMLLYVLFELGWINLRIRL